MNMFSRSWELVKASWGVLRDDKELMIFPIVSSIAVFIVMLTFAVPMVLAGALNRGFATGIPFFAIALGFLFYVLQYMIIFYCNSALIGAALIRLDGGQPTLRDGFRIANARLGSIFGYALLAATVGLILHNIAKRGIIGRIVASVVGLGWSIATFLAVPVLVVEGIGPIEAVKRSTQLLKKTWGEQIVGNVGIGFVFGLISFLTTMLFLGGLFAAISTKSTALILSVVAVFVVAILAVALIGSTLSAIYTAAVYRYATKGNAGAAFPPALISEAFRRQ